MLFFFYLFHELECLKNFFLNTLVYFFNFCCAGSSLLCGLFSSCGEQGPVFTVALRLLIAVAPLVAEHGLRACRPQLLRPVGSSAQAQLLCSTWDLPGPGIEPVSPALAGSFFYP